MVWVEVMGREKVESTVEIREQRWEKGKYSISIRMKKGMKTKMTQTITITIMKPKKTHLRSKTSNSRSLLKTPILQITTTTLKAKY